MLAEATECILDKIHQMLTLRITIFVLVIFICEVFSRPSESERVKLWYQAGNTWPPKWQNETAEYAHAMQIRENELMTLKGADERWENFMQYVQGRMVPSFTEFGFKVIQAPPHLHKKLLDAVRKATENWNDIPYEHEVDAIYHPEGLIPKFVYIGGLAQEVHKELLAIHEEWAGGIKLRPTSAYGVRLYQNQSSLAMHHDKVESHVISSIFHIDHEYDDDNEPWTIEIEDLNGQLHSVVLERGQPRSTSHFTLLKMLHYESAKCLHGRMSSFKGKYYGSIFLHYADLTRIRFIKLSGRASEMIGSAHTFPQILMNRILTNSFPVDKSVWNHNIEDVIAKVPPHWRTGCDRNHGSRWAGQSITTDSRIAAGAPPRNDDGDETDL
eukprot:gene8053-16511_t